MSAVRGHARRVRSYLALGISIVGLASLGYYLAPRYPDQPTRHAAQAPAHTYRPGGTGCDPRELVSIGKKVRRASEQARCAEADQEEQRAQDGLSEARYASDIAKQALATAEYQGWAFWCQALAAAAAFLAACFAGWAAYRAFRAAEATLSHAQEVAEAELRPYVFLGEVAWHYMNDPKNIKKVSNWRISLIWKNSGQTPAKRVFSVSSYQVFELSGPPDDFGFPDLFASQLVGSIGPGQTLIHRRELPVADFEAAYRNKKRLFLWAWIEYDGPSAQKRFRTEVCHEIIVRNDPTVQENWQFMQANLIGPFNGSENTCMHNPKT